MNPLRLRIIIIDTPSNFAKQHTHFLIYIAIFAACNATKARVWLGFIVPPKAVVG